ncbi:MAG: DUF4878 domain-containing protein [Thermoanaerobacter sp.]|nr:DUF4878 domain-containing protein [Thermoanaerobacter sp.]
MYKRAGLSLVAIAISLLILAGCSTTPPKSVVESFLSAIQAGDIEKASTYIDKGNKTLTSELAPAEDKFGEEFGKKILSRVKYEIKKQEISGDTAKVTATITSLDLVRIVTKAMSDIMPMAFAAAFSDQSEEGMNAMFEQYLINSISDTNAPTTTTDVIINLKKVDGKWLIVPDDNLLNSLTGNIEKAFRNFK